MRGCCEEAVPGHGFFYQYFRFNSPSRERTIPIEAGQHLHLLRAELATLLPRVSKRFGCHDLARSAGPDLGARALYTFDDAITFNAAELELGICTPNEERVVILALGAGDTQIAWRVVRHVLCLHAHARRRV